MITRAAPQVPEPLQDELAEGVAQRLRVRIVAAGQPVRMLVAGERILASQVLPIFYEDRLFQPVWTVGGFGLADDFVAELSQAGHHGLDLRDYHSEAIGRLLGRAREGAGPRQTAVLADLELLLTDAFLIYGAHLVSGRVDPETFDPEWQATRREVDLGHLLETAAVAGKPSEALRGLLPDHPAYTRLERALEHYRHLATEGPWPSVPDGPALRRGDRGERVAALADRLRASGDPREAVGDAAAPMLVFEAALEEAVRHFQDRHGLEPDGVVGPRTLGALQVPVEQRVRQIELNLERWRWLPRDLGERYILVDIPAFSLELIEAGRTLLAMRVVVGRSYRRTPVFSDTMRYLVVNPTWDVPTRLAIEDKLPEILKDPGYLDRMKIRVLEGWGADEREIDPGEVDWSKLGRGRFPYHLRQDPGPENALGRIKFMFPNKFDVYLHDTPGRELFRRPERAASSGCIRLERPLDLAEILLQDIPGWDRRSLEDAIASNQERMIPLRRVVAVHLLYWTVAVDEDGTVRFRNDIYGRDRSLEKALSEHPPAP